MSLILCLLSFSSFNLTVKQVTQIAKVFDDDGAGTIDYDEFVKFCECKDIREALMLSKKKNKKKKK